MKPPTHCPKEPDTMDPITHALAFIGGSLFIGAVWGISFKQKQSGRFLWWRGRT